MGYPTLEQYNEALQYPQSALVDAELKRGVIATTGLGLPLALCGGFALTYTVTVGGRKYAVRCFHKQSNGLEGRYAAIASQLATLKSPYFVEFQFQSQGVRVAGQTHPIVKMEWAAGSTLGEFVATHHGQRGVLAQLVDSLRALASYLERSRVAHGDIQPGNVMVAGGGGKLQLIDYDGMFVERLAAAGSAELGHRNFQHPARSESSWGPSLDRFSFIALVLALRALTEKPTLWDHTQSDADALLLRAGDFQQPGQSGILRELTSLPNVSQSAKNFAAVCAAPMEHVPSLEDFLAGRGIPSVQVAWVAAPARAVQQYIAAYRVLDASRYSQCLPHVGDRVEIVGRIVEVRAARTKYGKPYVFLNFGSWRGEMVKVSIWADGLRTLGATPDGSWVGKWLSVVGLLEPPYRNQRLGYSHLSVTVTQNNQMHFLSVTEAKNRLSAVGHPAREVRAIGQSGGNRGVLERMQGRAGASPVGRASVAQTVTPNQAVLQRMSAGTALPRGSQPPVGASQQPTASPPTRDWAGETGCFWYLIIGLALIWLLNR